jgi:TolB-like protein/Tfp pilus assembly protein PilF
MTAAPRRGFLSELKRRNVHRAVFAYGVGAWALIQIAETVFPYIGLPDSAITFVIALFAVGLVPALVVSWFFEISTEGLVRDDGADDESTAPARKGLRRFDYVTISLLTVLVTLFAFDRLGMDEEPVNATPQASLEPSIAVLPFENRSGNPDDVYFVDGIHDDIISSIGRIGAMKVIARTSVEGFTGPGISIADIGAELGVTAILEGGIQRAGDTVRINVRLIDVASEASQWVEDFERQLTTENIFAIQSEISQTVASSLQAVMTPDEKSQIENVPTDSLEAYELYLLGNQRMERRTAEALDEAVGFFEQALDIDPAFALAYVGLADSLTLLKAWDGSRDPAELLAPSIAAAEKAIELDPTLGEAYASLGATHAAQRTGEDPEPYFARAIELSPNYAIAYKAYGEYVNTRRGGNRFEQAKDLYERALALNPLSPIVNAQLGGVYRSLGQMEKAESRLRRAVEIDPDFSAGYMELARHFAALGRYDDAFFANAEALRTDPKNIQAHVRKVNYLTQLGDFDGAQRQIDLVRTEFAYPRWIDYPQAQLDLARFDEAGLERARRAFEAGDANDIHVGVFLLDLERRGEFERALEIISTPGQGVKLDPDNINQANFSTLAWKAEFLAKVGREDEANYIVSKVNAYMEAQYDDSASNDIKTQHELFRMMTAAEIPAWQGNRAKTLQTMQDAVDAGWVGFWFYFLYRGPIYDLLQDDPEFIVIRENILAKVAAQLARVRARRADTE